VRRCKKGSVISLFDGTGKTYLGKIEDISKDKITGIMIKEQQADPLKARVTLFNSVPKGERFDWLIEKTAELGISRVVPMICSRSIIKEISDSKISRWRRLSESACQQCSRPDVMDIGQPAEFAASLGAIKPDELSIIGWESEGLGTLKKALKQKSKFNRVNIFIGPEGGFEPREIEVAKDKGVVPVSLGNRILRVETAGIVASILVLNAYGEFE
jgi:16S rRNA (uracil1498-N3)-methyltransferase